MAPHGVYPCAGEDRWVAIAVRDDEDWRALCREIGEPALADDARYAIAAARLARQDEVDEIVSGFTRKLAMHEVEQRLQAARVPAHAVQNSPELVQDPQLLHRGHFIELPHPEKARTVVEATRFGLSRTPPHPTGPAPTFGGDTQWVLEEVLGYDGDRMAELVIAGALE
jgi:crotonobetainyl-CoA:carnitine CoA-transferase CaiB-like acyl-CoA transferase